MLPSRRPTWPWRPAARSAGKLARTRWRTCATASCEISKFEQRRKTILFLRKQRQKKNALALETWRRAPLYCVRPKRHGSSHLTRAATHSRSTWSRRPIAARRWFFSVYSSSDELRRRRTLFFLLLAFPSPLFAFPMISQLSWFTRARSPQNRFPRAQEFSRSRFLSASEDNFRFSGGDIFRPNPKTTNGERRSVQSPRRPQGPRGVVYGPGDTL